MSEFASGGLAVVYGAYMWPSARQLGLAEQDSRPAHHRAVGIACIEADFAYHDLRSLTADQAEQYRVWRQVAPGLKLQGSLHFYRVAAAFSFTARRAEEVLFDYRQCIKTWCAVDDRAHHWFQSFPGGHAGGA